VINTWVLIETAASSSCQTDDTSLNVRDRAHTTVRAHIRLKLRICNNEWKNFGSLSLCAAVLTYVLSVNLIFSDVFQKICHIRWIVIFIDHLKSDMSIDCSICVEETVLHDAVKLVSSLLERAVARGWDIKNNVTHSLTWKIIYWFMNEVVNRTITWLQIELQTK
jgi:hypothetical protein